MSLQIFFCYFSFALEKHSTTATAATYIRKYSEPLIKFNETSKLIVVPHIYFCEKNYKTHAEQNMQWKYLKKLEYFIRFMGKRAHKYLAHRQNTGEW